MQFILLSISLFLLIGVIPTMELFESSSYIILALYKYHSANLKYLLFKI